MKGYAKLNFKKGYALPIFKNSKESIRTNRERERKRERGGERGKMCKKLMHFHKILRNKSGTRVLNLYVKRICGGVIPGTSRGEQKYPTPIILNLLC